MGFAFWHPCSSGPGRMLKCLHEVEADADPHEGEAVCERENRQLIWLSITRANADVSTGRVLARACFVFGSRCMNEAEEASS